MFAADLQGHGRSEALKGMRGYADRFDDFVDDSQLILDQAYDVAGVTLEACHSRHDIRWFACFGCPPMFPCWGCV